MVNTYIAILNKTSIDHFTDDVIDIISWMTLSVIFCKLIKHTYAFLGQLTIDYVIANISYKNDYKKMCNDLLTLEWRF